MATSGFIIQQRGDVFPTWFSISEGRHNGSPLGGWTNDPDKALQFRRDADAKQFMETFVRSFADLKVVPVPEAP